MEQIPLPNKIEFTPGSVHGSAVLTIEPLFPGYGITIGNSLRRVLLSSLPGAAVTAIKITGALHEFSTVPNIKEDILEIILNVKQLRLRLIGEESAKLIIQVKGSKKVTAGDIEKNARVEIVNKNLPLCTITDPKGSFEAELTVERGRGYLPTEERPRADRDTGTIAIDALFSPVRNVAMKIENVRVGQLTNFDKVVMHIETDGAITPEEAVQQSVDLLLSHFGLIKEVPMQEVAAGTHDIEMLAAEPAPSDEVAAGAPAEAPSEDEKPKKRGRKKKIE